MGRIFFPSFSVKKFIESPENKDQRAEWRALFLCEGKLLYLLSPYNVKKYLLLEPNYA